MPDATAITVILPTRDRRRVLAESLAVHRALAARYRLVVIDDGSSDGSAAWLRGQGFEVVALPRRHGLPAVRNLGLRLSRTPWVFFAEDDVLCPADHPLRLLHEAARLPRCAAVAGRLFAGGTWQLPDSVPSASPGPLLDPALCLGDFAASLPRPRPLPSLHACALVDRVRALAVGGYDEDLGRGSSAFREESDFYARLWRAGGACYLTPACWAVHVRHRLGGGARGGAGLVAKLGNRWSYWRGNARFLDRHWRLWRRFVPCPPPGRQKARHAGVIIAQACSAWRSRGPGR